MRWAGTVFAVKCSTGQLVIDKSCGLYAPFLDKIDFLVEGVNGSLS